MASPCPKCKKSNTVVSIEDASVTYYYCESCDTGWSVDRRDPEAPVASGPRQRTARR
jgi:transposase-like protein